MCGVHKALNMLKIHPVSISKQLEIKKKKKYQKLVLVLS